MNIGQLVLGLISIGIVTAFNLYLFAIDRLSSSFAIVSGIWIVMSWALGKYIDLLRYTITYDSLTSAYSRTVAVKQYRRLLHRAKRKNGAVAIYFIDVDNFKQINDNYGHNIGDKMLSKIADQLLQLRIPEKVVVRWGGDEFVVMVPCQSEHEVEAALHLMNKSIQSINQQGTISLSISLGTAVYSHRGSHQGARPKQLEQLVDMADKQMLWNKQRKKMNMTVISKHTGTGRYYPNLCRKMF
ncbi:GGDEF domain-containing protein [Paenibacillus agilis]|uniref:GGDEF domain-containing protein n=1 Tax=Paenibacillus agilis TaxID=3020863 RepID=A0A559J0W8_9BACL|nr:GGDEF domain-containing protein [Paenibacillus agilis]TVX93535.1 GGDEF domain-containing protein [Paenibacillus agilis]